MGVSMLREGLSVALALLLASSSVLPTVQGCSEIFLGNTSVYDAVVSARNLDFFDSIDYSMVAVPRGTRAQYAPYSGCTPSPFNGPVKIGYVGNVADTSLAANYFNATCRGNNWANYAGVVLDGLNEAGLSCGMLTDQGSFLPSSNITGTTPALYFYDLCAYILSNFRTAAEVRQFFSSQRIQVVNNIMIFNALNSLSPIFGTRINHWSIHDAQSNSLLIEWVSESQYALRDNTAGVLTNSPNLPEQEAGYFEFRASQDAKFGAPAASIMTPGFCGVGWDSTTPENNNCNSMGRYTTLRQLKAAMYVPFVNAGVPMNPGYNPNPAHQAYSQAVLFLNWVTIPGSWPTYQTNITGPTEMTIVTYIRDHRNLKYIFRASTTMQWGEFDLRSLFSANGVYTRATRRLTLQPLQVLLPATQSFAINFNDALLPK